MKENLKQIMAQRIKEFRHKKGLTQAKLAERIDKSTEMVCKMESGASYTKLPTLLEIAEVLEVEPYELLMPKKDLLARNFSPDMVEIFEDLNEANPEIVNQVKQIVKILITKKYSE